MLSMVSLNSLSLKCLKFLSLMLCFFGNMAEKNLPVGQIVKDGQLIEFLG